MHVLRMFDDLTHKTSARPGKKSRRDDILIVAAEVMCAAGFVALALAAWLTGGAAVGASWR